MDKKTFVKSDGSKVYVKPDDLDNFKLNFPEAEERDTSWFEGEEGLVPDEIQGWFSKTFGGATGKIDNTPFYEPIQTTTEETKTPSNNVEETKEQVEENVKEDSKEETSPSQKNQKEKFEPILKFGANGPYYVDANNKIIKEENLNKDQKLEISNFKEKSKNINEKLSPNYVEEKEKHEEGYVHARNESGEPLYEVADSNNNTTLLTEYELKEKYGDNVEDFERFMESAKPHMALDPHSDVARYNILKQKEKEGTLTELDKKELETVRPKNIYKEAEFTEDDWQTSIDASNKLGISLSLEDFDPETKPRPGFIGQIARVFDIGGGMDPQSLAIKPSEGGLKLFGHEKTFVSTFNNKVSHTGFTAKETGGLTGFGKDVVTITAPVSTVGEEPKQLTINLKDENALNTIQKFLSENKLDENERAYSQQGIENSWKESNKKSKLDAKNNSNSQIENIYSEINEYSKYLEGVDPDGDGYHIINPAVPISKIHKNHVETKEIDGMLRQVIPVDKLTEFAKDPFDGEELGDVKSIINEIAFKKFKDKNSDYKPSSVKDAKISAPEISKFLNDINDDNITEQQFPDKQKYKEAFQKIYDEEKNNVINFVKEKNNLDPNSENYQEELAELNKKYPFARILNENIFQSNYASSQKENWDEILGQMPSEIKATGQIVGKRLSKIENAKAKDVLNKMIILDEVSKNAINTRKKNENNLKVIDTNISNLMEQGVEDGIFKETIDPETKKTKYEQIVDEKFLQENANNIYKENGVITNQQKYNNAAQKIVNDNPIVINGETITPGQKGFDEGAKKIIDKYSLPSQEQSQSLFNDIQSKVNNGQITIDQARNQWQGHLNDIKSKEEKLNKELTSYEIEYKKQAEKVNKLLLEFEKDQQNKKSNADKKIESSSKDILEKLKKFNSSYAPLKEEFDMVLGEIKDGQEFVDFYVNQSGQYTKEFEDIKLKKIGADYLALEGARQLENGFTFYKGLKAIDGFIDSFNKFGVQIQDLKEQTGDFFANNFGKPGRALNAVMDAVDYISPFGYAYDSENIYTRKTDKYGWHTSKFKDDYKTRQEFWAGIDANTRTPITYEQMKEGDWADWGEYWSDRVVDQSVILGTIVAAGPYALPILMSSASGNKYFQLQEELDLYERTNGAYGFNHGFGSMQANAFITGIGEGGSEYATAWIAGGAGKYFTTTIKEAAKKGFANNFARFFNPKRLLKVGGKTAGNIFLEGGSEVLANFTDNFADRFISGDTSVNLSDNMEEMFVNGAFFGGLLSTPILAADVMAPFISNSTKSTMGNISSQMKELTESIVKEQSAKNPDLKKIDDLNDQYAKLVVESNNAFLDDLKRVDLLHPSEKKILLEINKRNNLDNKKIKEIEQDNSLTLEQRTDKITDLASKIETRNKRKQDIISKYPKNVVDANYSAQVETMKQTAKMVKDMGGPNVNIKDLSQNDFQKEVKKYESDQQGMSSQQVEEISRHYGDMQTGLNEVINDKDASAEEISAAQELINDASNQVNLANNILNNSDYGVMQPTYDNKGRIASMNILINKDAAVSDGMFNTAAHEFVHATFANTLKADPQMRQIMGDQILDILNDTNIEFTPGKRTEFNKRINSYDPDVRGEEALAIASEMMMDGSIKFKDGPIKKLGGIFRRFGQFYLGHDIKFDDKNDIKNFLKDYHKSLKTHKPNPAIARMMAKGANGKIFKDARTPAERKDQSLFNKSVKNIINKNSNWKPNFDKYTLDPYGKPKYNSKEDFQMSDDFWDGFKEIMNSVPLKKSIESGVAAETGINTEQEMNDFVRKTLDLISERYLGGLTKNARNKIDAIKEQRAKGEITAKEAVERINEIKNNPNNNKKGFDPTEANGSLFGWLTGVAGGQGKSVIYRARGDVMDQWKKDNLGGTGVVVSTERQIGEDQTIGDKIADQKSDLLTKLDNVDMTPTKKRDLKEAVNDLLIVTDLIKLPNTAKKVIKDNIKSTSEVVSLEDITDPKAKFSAIKNIKNSIISKEFDPKILNPKTGKPLKSEKAVVPTGPHFDVLNAVSGHMGIDPLRILTNQDLSARDRLNAQDFIYDLIVKENGDLNQNFLKIFEGAAATTGGKATGLIGKTFIDLFNKKGRAKKSDTGAGLEVLELKNDITKNQLLNKFGINPDGSKRPGTAADGAIRQLGVVLSTLATVQNITENAIENNLAAADVVARLKDGTSEAMYNKKKPTKSEAQQIADVVKEQFNTDPKKYLKHQIPTIQVQKISHIEAGKAKRKTVVDHDASSPWNPGITMGQEIINIANDFLSKHPEFRELIKSNSSGGIGLGMFFTKPHADTMLPVEKGKQNFIKRNDYVKKSKDKSKNRRFDEKTLNKKDDSKQRLDLLYKFAKAMESHLKTGKNPKPQHLWFFTQLASDTVNNQGGGITRILSPFSFYTTLDGKNPDTINIMVEEHAGPQKETMNALVNAARTGTVDKMWPIVEATFAQGTLLETVDVGLKDIKNRDGGSLQSSLPDVLWDKVAAKILNGDFNNLPKGIISQIRYAVAGGDLNTIKWINGKTVMDNFGVGIKGKASQATVQFQNDLLIKYLSGEITQTRMFNDFNKFLNSEVKNESLNSYFNKLDNNKIEIDNNKNLQNLKLESSNMLSSKKVPKTKGISVFDFDDTLGITKSGVRAKIPNIDGSPKPNRKVVFLAGGAGSGKSNIVNKLDLKNQGFKIVNSDISLEWLKKNSGLPADMRDLTKEQRSTLGKLGAESRKIARRKMMKYQGNANGVVVDGTGGSIKSMTNLVNEFKDKGYDVSMLYVETSLDTALERNRARKERSLLDTIVKRNHEAVKNNKPKFKEMFGETFMEVNTDNLTLADPVPTKLAAKMGDFVSGYEKIRLDATEFAERGDAILQEGGEFDFSEFDKVVEGRPGPLLGKALERAKKYGTKDMFVLTARTQKSAQAIQEFLKSQGLNIPIENITGLANSTGDAKAQWMLEKFAEGYNDMYFADDALQNVDAVKKVLDQLDIKSDVVQAKLNQTNRLVDKSDSMKSKIIEPSFDNTINEEFNKILERKKGIAADKIVSEAEARRRGSQTNIARFFKSLYIPPSAEDFKGLMYYFVGKGKQGDADLKWFKEKLFDPFAKGIRSWNAYKQNMVNEYQALKKKFPKVSKSLNKLIPGTVFTNDTAIRTYLFDKAGYDIPGLSMQQKRDLIQHVKNNPDIMAFADALSTITRSKDGYPAPNANWAVSSIPGDMNALVNKVGRKQFLQDWINQKDNIFNKDNLNKIQAVYGNQFLESLNNILYRMENGGNRLVSPDSTVNGFVSWINGSVGAIMFFNMRSALLQTISTVNFINWSDNNIFKASAAFANQPQFWKDFAKLFNSDQLKQRRKGLQTDVSASELTKAFAERKMTPASVVSYLLSKGFTPTQLADSFAIAFGGASFYRNRFNKLKKEGMTDAQANEQAMLDFQEIAEETQQSSREDLVSQQQASVLGRMVLAFQNVTMQMGRLTKKAMSDLMNGRGDFKTNVSKIVYYAVVQNIVFAALQTGLAALMWGEDEEEIENRTRRSLNQALDSFLRGTGLYGALLSTLKNVIIQWHLQKDKPFGRRDKWKIAQEMASLSPPIGAKMRKIMSAFDTEVFNEGVGKKLGFRIENPEIQKWAKIIEATTNLPLARIVNKANNLEEAITGNHLLWQKAGLILGWSRWDVGIKDEELEKAKEEAKEERKEQKKIEKEIEKEEKKKEEEKEKKEKGIKTIRCSGIRSNGTRCKLTTETAAKTFLCVHHKAFKDGSDTDGDGKKEYRCIATKSNGKRCKNKTENANKKCYAHQ